MRPAAALTACRFGTASRTSAGGRLRRSLCPPRPPPALPLQLVQGLRLVPFSKETVIQLGVITLLPVTPLLLTMVSLEELVKQLLRIVL